MVKYYCDRCGEELENNEEIGIINIETRIFLEGYGVSYHNPKHGDKHYLICQNCKKGLDKYVKSVLDS